MLEGRSVKFTVVTGRLKNPGSRLTCGNVAADDKEVRKRVTVKRVDSMMPVWELESGQRMSGFASDLKSEGVPEN